MKAMIFAAGLGTRLKPLTNHTPKALIQVGGIPMLQHVILKLKEAGFTELVVNIHHLGEQITDFLQANGNYGISIHISDERNKLLDTGGGIKKAESFFNGNEPFLVHNVDILSNVNLTSFYNFHSNTSNDVSLLVSKRDTNRYLLFNSNNHLCGWINTMTGETKPQNFIYDKEKYHPYAFSGIQMVSPSIFRTMNDYPYNRFSITDFYLQHCKDLQIGCYVPADFRMIDIGKPETLACANQFLNEMESKV